ncbi:MAG: hypothetical protein M1833_003850 [Piccolia ochrophora]|nr:MAG: hypothetical protein M1833_003850 [Piccolia ochrophora]
MEKENDRQYWIVPGELFCRFNIGFAGEVEICDHNGKFSSTGNLRTYMKSHKIRLVSIVARALDNDIKVKIKHVFRYWKQRVIDVADSNDPSDVDTNLPPPTPKKGKLKLKPTKESEEVLLLPILLTKQGKPNKTEIRKQLGLKGNITYNSYLGRKEKYLENEKLYKFLIGFTRDIKSDKDKED